VFYKNFPCKLEQEVSEIFKFYEIIIVVVVVVLIVYCKKAASEGSDTGSTGEVEVSNSCLVETLFYHTHTQLKFAN
jgi:hypothetical protein